MDTTHYFLHYSYSNQPSNKLEREILNFFRSLDRKLIHAADLDETKKNILDKVAEINAKNSRCKPIPLTFYDNNFSKATQVSGFHKLNFYIYPAMLTHLSTVAYHSLSNN